MTTLSNRSGFTFKKFRITLLLLVFVFVAADAWQTKMRTTDWNDPLWVVVYPIDADGTSAQYIQALTEESFHSIERFFGSEANRYGLKIDKPVDIHLAPVLNELPPLPPTDGSMVKTGWWSLNFRVWAKLNDSYDGPTPDIKVFVLFHEVEENKQLAHSTGLEKGMISVVHAFASPYMEDMNNVVIAHEVLHTLGATDKYDLSSGTPIYPDGFADISRDPLYPQTHAEIMAGFIPLSPSEAVMPSRLSRTLVGEKTAMEIGWAHSRQAP